MLTKKKSFFLGMIAALAIVLTVALPAYFARRQGRLLGNHLLAFEFVLGGMRQYDNNFGKLPHAIVRDANGNVLYGWRLSITPFIQGFKEGGLDFDVAWNAEPNRTFGPQPNLCYSRRPRVHRDISGHVAIITGDNTPMGGGAPAPLAQVPCDTILVVEAEGVASHWMEPRDIALSEVNQRLTLGTDGKGILVGFADGQIWFLDRTVPIGLLKTFFVTDPASRDREAQLAPFRRFARPSSFPFPCQGARNGDTREN